MVNQTLEVKITLKRWVIPLVKAYVFLLTTFNATPSKKTCDLIIGHGIIVETVKNG